MRRLACIATLAVLVIGQFTLETYAQSDAAPAVVAKFNAKYAEQIEAAKKTRTNADDVRIALVILSDLAKTDAKDALAKYSCHQAYAQGFKDPAGYNYAILAMQYLQKIEPARNFEARRKIQRVYLAYFEHGRRTKDANAPDADAVLAQYTLWANDLVNDKQYEEASGVFKEAAAFAGKERLTERRLVIVKRLAEIDELVSRQKRIDDLSAKLAADATDKEALAGMIDIHLVEKDDPAAAMPFANKLGDETIQANVMLAVGETKGLSAANSLTLAKWYQQKGNDPSNKNRVAMFIRAKMYYEQFQVKHDKRDAAADSAATAKRSVDKSLAKLGVGLKLARRMVMKLRGDGPKQSVTPEIDRAIERGVAWLYSQQDRVTHWDGQGRNNANNFGGFTALVTYALLMAEEDPQIDDRLNRAVRWTFNQRLSSTYAVCFRAHMWEVLPDSEVFDRVIRSDADRLVRVVNDKGLYHYKVEKSVGGDLSTTLAGYLALWLAEISGGEVDDKPWQMIAERLVRIQRADGGWAYKNDNDNPTRGSMTAAGLTILLMALDQDHLTDDQARRANAAIEKSIEWFDRNFSPSSNPGGGRVCYYLVALQHVGVLSGRSEFKNMNWYETAAAHLVKTQQEDGSWGELSETALAVIFLSRGGIYREETSAADEVKGKQ